MKRTGILICVISAGIILIGLLSIILFRTFFNNTYIDKNVSEFKQWTDDSFEMSDHVDVVPDARTAILVADAYFKSEYGRKVIFNHPYKVYFDKENDLWIVRGEGFSLLSILFSVSEPTVMIHKKDGSIKQILHYKD